jgi:rRNA maturation endonuclease Nob1
VVKKIEKKEIEKKEVQNEEEDEEEEDDEDVEWITPETMKNKRKTENVAGNWYDNEEPEVGCITSDFSMQVSQIF